MSHAYIEARYNVTDCPLNTHRCCGFRGNFLPCGQLLRRFKSSKQLRVTLAVAQGSTTNGKQSDICITPSNVQKMGERTEEMLELEEGMGMLHWAVSSWLKYFFFVGVGRLIRLRELWNLWPMRPLPNLRTFLGRGYSWGKLYCKLFRGCPFRSCPVCRPGLWGCSCIWATQAPRESPTVLVTF